MRTTRDIPKACSASGMSLFVYVKGVSIMVGDTSLGYVVADKFSYGSKEKTTNIYQSAKKMTKT